MTDEYHVTLPVRCEDCGEVETKVETSIDVNKLPDCPHCGSAHFGGGGKTSVTRTPNEDTPSPEQLIGDKTSVEDDEEDGELADIIQVGLDEELSASSVLAYIATSQCGYSVDSWSNEYGVKQSTVKQYVSEVEDRLD